MARYLFPIIVFGGFTLMLSFLFPQSVKSAVPNDRLIVAELFTSQSCSSCPPADKVLQELAEHDNVIALSCNVTYWNHLHWEDTLSKQFCTDRQRSYARQLPSRVYTPQLVVNGRYELVGSYKGRVANTVAGTKPGEVQEITITGDQQRVELAFPNISNQTSLQVYLLSYKKHHVQDVPSGENRGRTLSYSHAVRDVFALEDWDGTSLSKAYPLQSLSDDVNGLVVLAQDKRSGEILSAGKLEF